VKNKVQNPKIKKKPNNLCLTSPIEGQSYEKDYFNYICNELRELRERIIR